MRERVNEHGWIAALKAYRIRFSARRRLSYALSHARPSQAVVQIDPLLTNHPVAVRVGTSDSSVYGQIFVEDEYGPLAGEKVEGLIIDCGANAGYSSALFLSRWPKCRVVAVEPDPENFQALQENLRPYGNRALLVRGGVWNRNGHLSLSPVPYRDGAHWSRQVSPTKDTETAAFPGFDIPHLLGLGRASRIAVLKVDIEGAEAVIFDESSSAWLPLVDRIAIELHDDTSFGDCRGNFFKAIARENFEIMQSGELTICRRLKVA